MLFCPIMEAVYIWYKVVYFFTENQSTIQRNSPFSSTTLQKQFYSYHIYLGIRAKPSAMEATTCASSSSAQNTTNTSQSHTIPNPPAKTQVNQFVGAPTPQFLQLMLPYLNFPLTIKPDKDNYLVWKNKLLNISIANGLEKFLDGTYPCPPRFLDSHQIQINPHYSL